MREWDIFSENKQHKIFDDGKTWNLGCKNNSKNRLQEETNKTNMNRQIKQLQDRLDSSKNSFEYFPDTASDSDKNYTPLPTVQSRG